MKIPNEAVKYILFQRTEYLRFPLAPVYRLQHRLLRFDTPLANVVVGIESRLRGSSVKGLFAAGMGREYRSIRAFLPETCSAVLDIGCGVAGIDVLIDRHYSGQDPDFYLLDKSRVEGRVYYLFRQRAAFYNSLGVARKMLTSNGIHGSRVHLIEAESERQLQLGRKVDLVISLIAWGFHFPVDVYLDAVVNLLSEQGRVILDVRKDTNGVDLLRDNFPHVRVISEDKKKYRVAAGNQPFTG